MKTLFSALAILCLLTTSCTSLRPDGDHSYSELRANQIITTTDDFIVDVFQNGSRVPDDQRELLAEIYGATVERIHVKAHRGDWLVFHVVNNRLRWNGCYYFAAAGMLDDNEYGFVSETKDGAWSACDDSTEASRFISDKEYLQNEPAQAITNPWADGTGQMTKFAGANWRGEPVWGGSRDTWLKLIVK